MDDAQKEDKERAKAFGQGCDARINGWPVEINPHVSDDRLWRAWRAGYLHVDVAWGMDAKWDFLPLPRVKRYA